MAGAPSSDLLVYLASVFPLLELELNYPTVQELTRFCSLSEPNMENAEYI